MNYELYVKLVNAGFPQKSFGEQINYAYERLPPEGGSIDANAFFPTLSEIIEACGDRFDYLIRRKTGGWAVHSWDGGDTYGNTVGLGSTPEEAVANLWIALNKK